MRRIVSVWLPDWPITRRFGATRSPPPEGPFALAERTARGLVVTAANRQARAVGVRIGQTHADAKAVCQGLQSAPAEDAEDARALDRLALWCERFSPSVSTDRIAPRLDGLTLDVSGAAHLFGGEEALLAEIERRLKVAGVPARAALADTVGAAWALARFGPPEGLGRVAAPGGTRAALAALPIEGLRLAEPTLVLLKRFGLRRIGDLYALPRAALARRFQGTAKAGDAALQVALRLDQALGDKAEAVRTLRPAPVYRVWRTFADPILIVEGVEQRLPELVGAMADQLDRDGQGARRLALTAFRVDGRTTAVEVGFSLPAHVPAHLARVLRDAGLERLDLGFGADALMLTAPACEAVAAEQSALEPETLTADLPALIDRLQAKLGPLAVRRPRARASWIPERSEVLVRADTGQSGQSGQRKSAASSAQSDQSNQSGQSFHQGGPAGRLRPLLLLDPPERAEGVLSELPDYPPRSFVWRAVRRRVVRAQGPERIAPEWWRSGLPPPGSEAEANRPALKVAREDVMHIERQEKSRQNSRKSSNPGVCVPALPAATGLEGRRPALSLVAGREMEAVPDGRTLDGYPPPPTPSFPLDGGRWPRGAGSDGGGLAAPSHSKVAQGSTSTLLSGREDTPIRPFGPPSPIKGEGESHAPLPRTRDYFIVEDEQGDRFWLFRDGLFGRETQTPTWWVHGVFG